MEVCFEVYLEEDHTQGVPTLVRLPLPAPLSHLALLQARPRLLLWVSLLSHVCLSPIGLISVNGENPWVLDSEATYHLTDSSEHFISYAPCASNEKIWIVDGSITPIATKGQMVPFDDLAFQNILHVPKLSYNLLSITKSLVNYTVKLSSYLKLFVFSGHELRKDD